MAIHKRAAMIRMLALDVDGTLTEGGVYVGGDGELFKCFDIKDGLGISLWHKAGGMTALITGRSSPVVMARAKELHIDAIWQGCADKRQAYEELKAQYELADQEIAYMGDDLIDLPILRQVGLAAAPADAAAEVREQAHLIVSRPGGHGAVRELVEFILKSQGRWENIVASFLG